MPVTSSTAAASNAWSGSTVSTTPNPMQQGSATRAGFPSANYGNRMPPRTGNIENGSFVTQFSAMRPSVRLTNSVDSNYYATANTASSFNPAGSNFMANMLQQGRNGTYNERLKQLENENTQRRTSSGNLEKVGLQLLQSQMDVQEQILQYQLMLEQCMETIDYQSFILSGQSAELAFLRNRLQHFEYIMDIIAQVKKANQLRNKSSKDFYNFDIDSSIFNAKNPSKFHAQSRFPFFNDHLSASEFQPRNQRTSSSNNRFSYLDEVSNMQPSVSDILNACMHMSAPSKMIKY